MPVAGRPFRPCISGISKPKVFKAVVVPVRLMIVGLMNWLCRMMAVYAIYGGAERADSVQAGLDWIQAQGAENDWVFVHDARTTDYSI